METKRRYEHSTAAAGAAPAAGLAERALRVFTQPERNPGIPLDLDLVRALRITAARWSDAPPPSPRGAPSRKNGSRVAAARHHLHRPDHAAGRRHPTNVLRLCAKAKSPVRRDLLGALGATGLDLKVGAVCVYHASYLGRGGAREFGDSCGRGLDGIPRGAQSPAQRIEEIKASVAAGAQEIDVVITRALALAGAWEALYAEVAPSGKPAVAPT